jgi:hypothetical protein
VKKFQLYKVKQKAVVAASTLTVVAASTKKAVHF